MKLLKPWPVTRRREKKEKGRRGQCIVILRADRSVIFIFTARNTGRVSILFFAVEKFSPIFFLLKNFKFQFPFVIASTRIVFMLAKQPLKTKISTLENSNFFSNLCSISELKKHSTFFIPELVRRNVFYAALKNTIFSKMKKIR